MTILHNQTFEEFRTLSKLSDRLHYFSLESNHYSSISGLILPYNLTMIIILWCLTDSLAYRQLITSDLIDQTRVLNPNRFDRSDDVPYSVLSIVNGSIKNWDSKQIDDLVPSNLNF